MDYRILFKEENENIKERYELAMDRIAGIPYENTVAQPYREYFVKVAEYITFIRQLSSMADSGDIDRLSLDEHKSLNHKIYKDILPGSYDKSYANPTYAVAKTGKKAGALLAALYTDIRGLVAYAYENRMVHITIYCELFIEIYNYFEQDDTPDIKALKNAIYWFYSDNCDITLSYHIRELFDPKLDFATRIIMESNLDDLRYLYKYGEYIGENETRLAAYLNSLPQEKINKMADAYTDGYRLGFELGRKDLSKKKTVDVRYNIGFERIVKRAIENFRKMGLEPVIYRGQTNSVNGRERIVGYTSTLPNKQYWYDHRFDNALYLNKSINQRKLDVIKSTYESIKEMAAVYAGPAVIEIFGEEPFEPVSKPETYSLGKRQQKLGADFSVKSAAIVNKYTRSSERSFTIVSFPVPAIGDKFEDIFEETVKINTLDLTEYRKVHQALIDNLDKAEYVRIAGKSNNKTYLTVAMNELHDHERETNFENCLADVNIPLGEVFTSPRLTGTNGLLHVSEVYLNGLKYIDLEITFEDGCIKEYNCKNFDSDEKNKKYIKQNILKGHDTLPMGEFAIGTNTTAFVMAEKFQILYKLPILIVEKMGPHFAVGDTCFNWEEDNKTYNPDGKEMAAKDNEISILRKEDVTKAYFNCHTDITIPYPELGEVTAVCSDATEIPIIYGGRFVLPGTELLNKPLDGEKCN